jgi:glutamine phosphoribosylpyrophosphate amidotransferase
LLQDEASIRAADTAKMREGKRATMVRQAEKEKHAHGHLQDERAIVEADISTATSF